MIQFACNLISLILENSFRTCTVKKCLNTEKNRSEKVITVLPRVAEQRKHARNVRVVFVRLSRTRMKNEFVNPAENSE